MLMIQYWKHINSIVLVLVVMCCVMAFWIGYLMRSRRSFKYRYKLKDALNPKTQQIKDLKKEISNLRLHIKEMEKSSGVPTPVQKSYPLEAKHSVLDFKSVSVQNILKQVLKLSGIEEHVEYMQSSWRVAGRSNAIIHLPEGRCMIVDVDIPLKPYVSVLSAKNHSARLKALKKYTVSLRKRMAKLAEKSYWKRLRKVLKPKDVQYVLLFLPVEAMYSTALQGDPHIFQSSNRSQVHVVSPSSLLSMTKTIHFMWREHDISRLPKKAASSVVREAA